MTRGCRRGFFPTRVHMSLRTALLHKRIDALPDGERSRFADNRIVKNMIARGEILRVIDLTRKPRPVREPVVEVAKPQMKLWEAVGVTLAILVLGAFMVLSILMAFLPNLD